MLEDSLYDETTRPFLIGPSIADFGRGLDLVNNLTNKIPGLNSITDQLDYDSGDFSRFLGRAQEQPWKQTGREVLGFAQGRMTDIPAVVGAAEVLPALFGAGASTATGLAGLGVRTAGALGNLAKSHPMISTLVGSIGLDHLLRDDSSGVVSPPKAEDPAPQELANSLMSRNEANKQSALSRRDEILSAIRNGGTISVGPDDNLAEMGIGETFSKTHGTMAQPSSAINLKAQIAQKIDSEVIPQFQKNVIEIENKLRTAYRQNDRQAPTRKNAKGIESAISGEEFDAYVSEQARQLAFQQVPPSLRPYIPVEMLQSRNAASSDTMLPEASGEPTAKETQGGVSGSTIALGAAGLATALYAAKKGKLGPLKDLIRGQFAKEEAGFILGEAGKAAEKVSASAARTTNKASRLAREAEAASSKTQKLIEGHVETPTEKFYRVLGEDVTPPKTPGAGERTLTGRVGFQKALPGPTTEGVMVGKGQATDVAGSLRDAFMKLKQNKADSKAAREALDEIRALLKADQKALPGYGAEEELRRRILSSPSTLSVPDAGYNNLIR